MIGEKISLRKEAVMCMSSGLLVIGTCVGKLLNTLTAKACYPELMSHKAMYIGKHPSIPVSILVAIPDPQEMNRYTYM